MLPSGISNGFVTVVLPFLLTKNGFPVALTASIVAFGISANLWRFVWGPVVDMSLSLRKWYWISILVSVATLLLLCYTPFTVKGKILLFIITFISQVAGTFTILPVNGIMANRIEEKKKGMVSGWFQAGNLAGTGLGGGAGLWMATHFSVGISGIILSVACLLFALFIFLIKDIRHSSEKSVLQEISALGKSIFSMVKIPAALFVVILIAMPIGSGAMSNLWSTVAQDWKADADMVALVTGILNGIVSALGCVAGGFIIDKFGIWKAYFGLGIICAVITAAMAVLKMQPSVFAAGVLVYGFTTGLVYGAYTALLLYACGKKYVPTKFSLLSSLGNLPVVYMTAIDGWVHDKHNSRYMLMSEAVIGVLFVIIFILILKRMMHRNMIPATLDS